MLDLMPILDMVKSLSNAQTVTRFHGKAAYVQLFNNTSVFACHTQHGNVVLRPITLRLTYDKRVSNIHAPKSCLQAATIICSTRHNVEEVVGTPVCLYSTDFEIHGRLRRSKCDRLFSSLGSSYLTLSILSIVSSKQCDFCNLKPAGETCNVPSCRLSHPLRPFGKIKP